MSSKEKEIKLSFTAEVHKEENWYVATNLELGIASQVGLSKRQ